MSEFKREYKVQMFRRGKWMTAHIPHVAGSSWKTYPTMAEADEHEVYIEAKWNEYRDRCKKFEDEMDGRVEWDNFPEKFRIVSRKVTEWE